MAYDNYSSGYSAAGSRKTGGWRSLALIAAGAFVLGAAAVGYFAWKAGDGELPSLIRLVSEEEAEEAPTAAISSSPVALPSEPVTPENAAEAVEQAAEAVEQVALQQGGLDQRIAGLEQRIARLDLQAQAASGNAARAEGLLIAFAARRRIERGEQLGYLEDQLRLRFRGDAEEDVDLVIEAAKQPVTLDSLLARLEGLAPDLTTQSISEGGFDWFKRQVSELFIIRPEDSPSPDPERRLERARLFLQTDRPAAAISEIRAMPGSASAEQWLADAERFAAARRALDRLETFAVLDTQELRDAGGNRVEQLSPGQAGAE